LKTKDFLTRKFKILGFSYSLNVASHLPPPTHIPSVQADPQAGGGQVQWLS
jgi:hypothetical protein